MDVDFSMPYSCTSIVDVTNNNEHSGSIAPSISTRDFASFVPPVHSDIEKETGEYLEYLIKLVDRFIPCPTTSVSTGMAGMANVQPVKVVRLSHREASAIRRRSEEMRKILKLTVKRREIQQQLIMGAPRNGNFASGFLSNDPFQVYPALDNEAHESEMLYVFMSGK
jgi:hypothetical protein